MAPKIESFKELRVWQHAKDLSVSVYRATLEFPKTEQYGLVSQLRRSAVSVPSNIAEGYGRGSRPEYLRFLKMARASLFELETQLIIAEELNMLDGAVSDALAEQALACNKLLAGLIRRLDE